MSLYQCTKCGCRENTATGHYYGVDKPICSKCHTGEWHNHFEQVFLPHGEFHTNREGNLQHTKSGVTGNELFEAFGRDSQYPPQPPEVE